MYRVEVQNACRCFLKSGLLESQSFQSKEEAKNEAEYLLGVMESTFCHKHKFTLSELLGNYTIAISSK